MATRRRAPKVVWLPPSTIGSVNAQSPPVGNGDESTWRQFSIAAGGGVGDVSIAEVPLVIDGADNQVSLADSIADLYSASYRLRRIVGKIYIGTRTDEPEATGPRIIGVTAGIIVRRTDPVTGQSVIGQTGNVNNISPDRIVNSNDPWVFRRNWLMMNPRAPLGVTNVFGGTLQTNNYVNMASSLDGPHVDQKTARIVGPEERLFLTVSATVLVLDGASVQDETTLDVFFDFRVLASLKSGSGNRRNATR